MRSLQCKLKSHIYPTMQKLGPQEISNRTHWTDPEKLPQYLIARLQLTGRGPLVRSHGQFLMDDIPWKSNPHFLQAGFRTTSILVRFYHRPKKLEQVWRGYQCYGILYGKGGHWLNGGGGEWWLRRDISIYYVVGGYLALKKGHLIHRNKVEKNTLQKCEVNLLSDW